MYLTFWSQGKEEYHKRTLLPVSTQDELACCPRWETTNGKARSKARSLSASLYEGEVARIRRTEIRGLSPVQTPEFPAAPYQKPGDQLCGLLGSPFTNRVGSAAWVGVDGLDHHTGTPNPEATVCIRPYLSLLRTM